MKKKVKALIIAASVAAIAGIGAVSFAKWQAGTDNVKEVANNQLGAVSVLKFGETVPVAFTGLLPVDQGSGTVNAPVTFKIITSEGYDKSDFKLTVKLTMAEDNALQSGSGIYGLMGTTAPTATAQGTEITAAGTEYTYNLTDADENGVYTLQISLKSDKLEDMNQKFTLTYTLSDGTTAA